MRYIDGHGKCTDDNELDDGASIAAAGEECIEIFTYGLCVDIYRETDGARVVVADVVWVVPSEEVDELATGEYSGASVEGLPAAMYHPVGVALGHTGRCRVAMSICILDSDSAIADEMVSSFDGDVSSVLVRAFRKKWA